jgi:hypothetical protein
MGAGDRPFSRALFLTAALLTAVASALVVWTAGTAWTKVRPVSAAEAWTGMYSVLTSPRCINYHTATNYPQQSDERRRHFANVVRGPEDQGVAGLNCTSCHQEANANSTGVPGSPNWHLAPLSMRWQDTDDHPLSSGDICRALKDPLRNHGFDGPGLMKHHEEDALVLWAWDAGIRADGTSRAPPPITHQEFVDDTRTWVAGGMPCP